MNIHYYLINGIDKTREPRMKNEFKKWGLDETDITWMKYPNKDDLSIELIQNIVNQNDSYSCGLFIPGGRLNMNRGVISCTYKHYLCLKQIAESDYDYGVIIEDNMYFSHNIADRIKTYIIQLDEYYVDWDVLFDSSWKSYSETELIPEKYVYPKSIEITEQGHGGTRCAQFYLMTKSCAKKLYENYLPFNNAPDWHMNDLFRKLNIKSFWAEPSIAHVFPHVSTAN